MGGGPFLYEVLAEELVARESVLARKKGAVPHKSLFISPLKLLDSLLGASLAALRTVFIVYLLSVILIASPWSIGDKYIASSQFYTYTDSHLPKVVTELKTYGDNLFKQIN